MAQQRSNKGRKESKAVSTSGEVAMEHNTCKRKWRKSHAIRRRLDNGHVTCQKDRSLDDRV
jgi:hypothetical protein